MLLTRIDKKSISLQNSLNLLKSPASSQKSADQIISGNDSNIFNINVGLFDSESSQNSSQSQSSVFKSSDNL